MVGRGFEGDGAQLKIETGGKGVFGLDWTESSGLQLVSPAHYRGGAFSYVWDDETSAWVSPKDQHTLIECLARDLMYLCNGMPHF
jgi:hypothetical protein